MAAEKMTDKPQAPMEGVESFRVKAESSSDFDASAIKRVDDLDAMLKDAAGGNTSALVRAAIDAEEKVDAIFHSNDTRTEALLACKVVWHPADDSPAAEERAETVRTAYGKIKRLRDTIKDLQYDARYLGFSLGQMFPEYDENLNMWLSRRIDIVYPQALTWRFDDKLIDFPRLITEDESEGMDLEPYRQNLILHTYRRRGSVMYGGLVRPLMWLATFAKFTMAEWISFIEIWGKPILLGKYKKGTTSEKEKDALKAALFSLMSDSKAMMPDDMEIEPLEVQRMANSTFYKTLDKRIEFGIEKIVLGQTKTSDGEGGSNALAKVHDLVRMDKKEADAGGLADTLTDQFATTIIGWNYGDDLLVPTCEIIVKKPTDREKEIRIINGALESGMPVSKKEAYEKAGLSMPTEDEEVLEPRAEGGNTNPFAVAAREHEQLRGKRWARRY